MVYISPVGKSPSVQAVVIRQSCTMSHRATSSFPHASVTDEFMASKSGESNLY